MLRAATPTGEGRSGRQARPVRTGRSRTGDALSCLFQQIDRIGTAAGIDCILDKFEYFREERGSKATETDAKTRSGGSRRMLTLNVQLINEQ